MGFDPENRHSFSKLLVTEPMTTLRESLRLGAYGLKKYYNRDLAIGFGVALLVHLLFMGWSCSTVTTNADIADTVSTGPVVIMPFGGSGGMEDSDDPIGPTPKGDVKATGRTNDGDAHSAKSASLPPPAPNASTGLDGRIKPTKERLKPPGKNDPKTNPSTTTSSSGGTDSTGGEQAHGKPNGSGNTPAGGSGGITVGDGEGIGRCWQKSPSRAARGATTSESGRVVVAFRVRWDGTLTTPRRISGTTTLFNKVRSLLAGVRACRATPDTPEVEVSLTYNFQVK